MDPSALSLARESKGYVISTYLGFGVLGLLLNLKMCLWFVVIICDGNFAIGGSVTCVVVDVIIYECSVVVVVVVVIVMVPCLFCLIMGT